VNGISVKDSNEIESNNQRKMIIIRFIVKKIQDGSDD